MFYKTLFLKKIFSFFKKCYTLLGIWKVSISVMSFCFRNIISQIGDWGFRYLKIIQEYNFLKKDILNSYQIKRLNFLRKINLTNKLERERMTDNKNILNTEENQIDDEKKITLKIILYNNNSNNILYNLDSQEIIFINSQKIK